jgi:hypothetical protein
LKTITRTVWILPLISLFTDTASEMLYPIMPIFLKSIGFSVVLIGILEGITEATAGLCKIDFGAYCWSNNIFSGDGKNCYSSQKMIRCN